MAEVSAEDAGAGQFDPLREQDWSDLGVEVDGMDGDEDWDCLEASARHSNSSDLSVEDDVLVLEGPIKTKAGLQFSPVAVDTVAECCLDTGSGWPFGGGQFASNTNTYAGMDVDYTQTPGDSDSEDTLQDMDDAQLIPFAIPVAEEKKKKKKPALDILKPNSKEAKKLAAAKNSLSLSLAIPEGKTEPQLVETETLETPPTSSAASSASPPDSTASSVQSTPGCSTPSNATNSINNNNTTTTPGESSLFPVHLFVTAIADGKIINDTVPKTYAVLEQVRRKVSKEQNTVVQVSNEGAVDLKMRVFVANSVEAKAVGDYIASHPTQVPAPFVVLSKQLLMAVSYDANTLNPSHASVADRLRKQIKTHAVKVLREAIGDKNCSLTTSMLRGYSGPMAPANFIEPLVQERAISVPCHPARKYIVLPAKNKTARDDRSGGSSVSSSPRTAPRSSSYSSPTDELEGNWEGRLTAHFPVNLFVTAIADGEMAKDTPSKVQERLSQIVRKVPKEQNTSVEVAEGATIDLKMRVFVVNSEDAKAVGEYIKDHLEQRPAPFVVLARHLPMAVLYDPLTLDLSDASVADRLRKQAKTRAVKVLREAIGNKAIGISQHMLRGHCGAMQPAEKLADFLASRTQPLDGDQKNRCVVFAARNKGCSLPCSPRKRSGPDSPPMDDFLRDPPAHTPVELSPETVAMLGGLPSKNNPPKPLAGLLPTAANNRKIGTASASHLHRNMLDKAFNKKARLDPLIGPTPPLGSVV